ncbi:MAG: hypothetical protein M3P83_07680 [Actinomycetota bacterium]|nr:hypothetical protein [Actinomycetota bacterium]
MQVPAGRLSGWIDRFARRHGPLTARGTADTVHLSAADGAWACLHVPWPPLPWSSGEPGGEDPVPLVVAHAERHRRLGLLLVRRGGFAVAVVHGDTLAESAVGARHVQGRTKAGGRSQQRYARRRAHQAQAAFAAAADAAAVVLLPPVQSIEGLVCGGDRRAVAAVVEDPRLTPLTRLPQGRFLAVPDPRRRVLEDAARRCRDVLVDLAEPPSAG